MTGICITNEMQYGPSPRPWPCVRRGVHLETCENNDCWGCFPREADRGLLCQHCYEKAVDMLGRVRAMILHLRSIENGGQALGERVSTSREHRIPVPQSWLSADELLVALGGPLIPSTATHEFTAALVDNVLSDWEHPGMRVSSVQGARAAVLATLLLQKALRRWPGAEAEKRAIPRPIRCTKCSSLALYRHAPLEYLGDLFVQCEVCGERHDWWEWSKKAAKLAGAVDDARKQEEKRRKAARKERTA